MSSMYTLSRIKVYFFITSKKPSKSMAIFCSLPFLTKLLSKSNFPLCDLIILNKILLNQVYYIKFSDTFQNIQFILQYETTKPLSLLLMGKQKWCSM